MKHILLYLALLLAALGLAFGQGDTQGTTQDGSHPYLKHSHTKITGCLTRGEHDAFELVDQKGVTNLVYSASVKLDPYVGKSVTLVGDQSATPSTDTGTARPMPHFFVKHVHPASSTCNK